MLQQGHPCLSKNDVARANNGWLVYPPTKNGYSRTNEFAVRIQSDPKTGKTIIGFDIPTWGWSFKEQRFTEMLQAIGVDPDIATLSGTTAEILHKLDDALRPGK
jgi:hypothetical protein